ncbi:PACE efflux transporter [Silicimonas sp. MF1-12-2]|uniref:PACE efflux transporter n=1 Tax=Silicimonas sp. MF1-12-2 TaxID=3384793 RepID=UPI0039B5A040
MTLRSLRERIIQTVSFELGGLLVVAPAYAVLSGSSPTESLGLLIALSIAFMIWSPIHNTLFDVLEFRFSHRVASDRPHGLRIVHAISHETTSIVVTLPLIMYLGGYGFWVAIAVDLGLTIAYTAYAYLFHVVFDRLRPVTGDGRPAGGL